MSMLLAVLMSVVVPSTAQQQRTLATVYKVYYTVHAEGSFVRGGYRQLSERRTAIDGPFAVGSAFAVDESGWLMTVRHVVDMEAFADSFCEEVKDQWAWYRVDRLRFEMRVSDMVGTGWQSHYSVSPPAGSKKDICRSLGPLQVQLQDGNVSIEKVDDISDLGLLKIQLRPGDSIVALNWGSLRAVRPGQSVHAFGFINRGNLTRRVGVLMNPCTVYYPKDGPSEHLSSWLFQGQQGMSGGPIISDYAVVGIIDRANRDEPVTLAIPIDYALDWYLWARGIIHKRPMTVCIPTMMPDMDIFQAPLP